MAIYCFDFDIPFLKLGVLEVRPKGTQNISIHPLGTMNVHNKIHANLTC